MAQCENCGAAVAEGLATCPECNAAMDGQEENASRQTASAAQETERPQKDNLSAKMATLNDTADTTGEFTKEDMEQNKVMAVLAYILFFIPLLAAKDSPFARYHANQGLVLFLLAIIGGPVLSLIPVLGWILAPILSILITVLAVIGIVNAVNGRAKELPLIGKFRILK